MKKTLFFAAAALAMLASCSQNDLEAPVVAQSQQGDAIEFGTYVGGAAGSRAATPTSLTTENLKSFGVFAFYSEGVSADGALADTDIPNFMFNQKVTGGHGNYTYAPVKYWPNQDGVETNGKEDHKDVLSFFAYAPYAGLNDGTDASTGTDNGIALEDGASNSYTNTTTYATKPKIYYKRNETNYNADIDVLWATPQKNLVKQAIDGKVNLQFKHAMTKIAGKVNVRYLKDLVNTGGTTGDAVDATTTVKLKKVYIWIESASDNIIKSGWLSLEDGTWTGDATKYGAIADYNAANTNGFAVSKEAGPFAGLTDDLVTNENKLLTDIKGFMLIPGITSNIKIKARAVYDVETTDANLNGGKSTVENDITNEITVATANLLANKNYVINLVLGLTSIKLDAVVTNWEDTDPTSTGEIDLPKNETTPTP